MGAVLRSTSLLPAIKRKFPSSHITWLTESASAPLLAHNPFIDRVLRSDTTDAQALNVLEFDVALSVDKSLVAAGFLKMAKVDHVYGFTANRDGVILPATAAATELWEVGLSDHLKFHVNRKTEQQLTHEALELGPFLRDRYILNLTEPELTLAEARRMNWGKGRPLIGINTGCSPVIPYKKLSVQGHRELVRLLAPLGQVVLLGGGKEDHVRNLEIAQDQPQVIVSDSLTGLRDGISSMAAMDVVVSGDSLGMHLAIALEKWVVAWFGPTCSHEIDLYDRGIRVQAPVPCSPCWKRSCNKPRMCYDAVDLKEIVRAVGAGLGVSREQAPASGVSRDLTLS